VKTWSRSLQQAALGGVFHRPVPDFRDVTVRAVAPWLLFFIAAQACPADGMERVELKIAGGDTGVGLFAMHIAAPSRPPRGAVVFVHGAGSGGSAIWDLRFRDYSLMRRLACEGFDTYAYDARGFGGSWMPPEMSGPADAGEPAVRAQVAARDLGAAIAWAAKTSSVAAVDVVAWSWGCEVSGLYAGRHPERVRRLALYAPIYDRRWPARHRSRGVWYPVERAKLEAFYDPAREAREVWTEHLDALFRFSGDPALVRLPSGPYRDIYGPDAPIWDPAKVRAPVLIIRGDLDPASLAEPAARLFAALTAAREKTMAVVGGASHFLPRERGYRVLQRLLVEFLSEQ
jgi:pimeloyl-ACP methyl ester carboxylesterase